MRLERKIDRELRRVRNSHPGAFPAPRLRLLERRGPLRVYLVDATKARLRLPDFTMGDHDLHSPGVVPRNEVWIANELGLLERQLTTLHELHERRLMAHGMPYGLAHERATAIETTYRLAGGRGLGEALRRERGR